MGIPRAIVASFSWIESAFFVTFATISACSAARF